GSPVTAKDVEFTFKTLKCPLVNNPNSRSYYEYITDFQFYDDDPLKFTIVSTEIYFLAEASFTDVCILPEYFYDPKGLMKNISIKQIADEGEKLKSDTKMKEFADDFNSEKRMRDPNFIGGSGPYKYTEWKTNERVVLTKKENWWGDALQKENCYFEAFPDKLIYQFIKDQTTALVSLKAGNLDVMRTIKSKDFAELSKSEKFTQNFNAYTPVMYAYSYLGLNLKSPLLTDKLTRQALAYIVDCDKMIETIKYGQAEKVIGPVHPSKKNVYNTSIVPYNYNLDKAKELLSQAGWKNTNGDETLDKMLDGKRTEFIVDFIVNAESDERKSMALMFQAEAKKVGIKVNVLSIDWAVFMGRSKNHQFDIIVGTWVGGSAPDDFKAVFHSESSVGEGSNYSNFSNTEADSLITYIRMELDEEKRAMMYKRFQEILHEEVPMIFLWAPTERIAISKKFDNAYPSAVRPGYWEQGFTIKAVASSN
ncbi:MAG: ABC transporter substrate-binding protein, partial [Bacteroidota bacterium]